MFPHGSDYIFILISKASPISDRLAVLPEGIVVEPSGFPAWLLIVFVFKRSEFPAVKEIFVSTLLYRPAVVYFTGCPTTQNKLRDICIITLVAKWFVLRIMVNIVTDQLLPDSSPAQWTLRLQQLPEFVLFGGRAEINVKLVGSLQFPVFPHYSMSIVISFSRLRISFNLSDVALDSNTFPFTVFFPTSMHPSV
nr:MAG TPA: hypothetical protein [Caudoviricetes sp.]